MSSRQHLSVVPALDSPVIEREEALPENVHRGPFAGGLVTKNELAAHYRVHYTTIDRWVKRGMPFEPVGNRKRFRVSACEEWHRKEFGR